MPRMISFEYLMKLISVSYVFHLLASGEKVQKAKLQNFMAEELAICFLLAGSFSTCRELF